MIVQEKNLREKLGRQADGPNALGFPHELNAQQSNLERLAGNNKLTLVDQPSGVVR
jgi:hypothetical protein